MGVGVGVGGTHFCLKSMDRLLLFGLLRGSEVQDGRMSVEEWKSFIAGIFINHAGSKCVLAAAGQHIRDLDQISCNDQG